MFVNNFGTPIVIVVVGDGSEERLKVGYEEERDMMLLFKVGEFKFAIVGVGVNNLLWGVFDAERYVIIEYPLVGKRMKAGVADIGFTFVFCPTCY